MFRPSTIRLASHLPGTRGLKFPDRKAKPQHHEVTPHPCAPQSIIDRFPEWQKARMGGTGSFSSYGSSGDKSSGGQTTTGGASPSKPSASGGSSAGLLEEWELPAHLARTRYAPTEAECDAIDSGGATESPVISKGTWEKWHLAQI